MHRVLKNSQTNLYLGVFMKWANSKVEIQPGLSQTRKVLDLFQENLKPLVPCLVQVVVLKAPGF